MDCKRVQELIAPFVNDTIKQEETKDFLIHIASCKECREELEVSYSIMTAMKQLDRNTDMSDNYIKELNEKIKKCIQDGILRRRKRITRRLVLAFLVFLLLFMNGSTVFKERQRADKVLIQRIFYRENGVDKTDTKVEQEVDETENSERRQENDEKTGGN